MKQIVNIEAMEELSTPIPAKPAMTRTEKLLHWAGLVRKAEGQLQIFHNLEKWHRQMLTMNLFNAKNDTHYGRANAFSVALADPVLSAAGFKGTAGGGNGSAADVMGFFELSQAELHEFSCDCGGQISNREMANRIERLAAQPTLMAPSLMQRAIAVFR